VIAATPKFRCAGDPQDLRDQLASDDVPDQCVGMDVLGDGARRARRRRRHHLERYVKDPLDPAWADDPGVKGWRDFMAKYVPDGDVRDSNYVNGYNNGMVLEHVLKAAGNDLSRENILRQALSIKESGIADAVARHQGQYRRE
jgi:hypothetical protein